MVAAPILSLGQQQAEKSGLVLWTMEAQRIIPNLSPALTFVPRTSPDRGMSLGQNTNVLPPACPKGQEQRSWIKVRLTRPNPDVEDVLAGWAAHRKKSQNIVNAILLYEAILQGDIDGIGRLLPPEKKLLIETAMTKIAPSPVLESLKESKKRLKTEDQGEKISPEVDAIIDALVILCAKDRALNNGDLVNYATQLHVAGYTGAEVARWGAKCWVADWRAKKGERPTFKIVIDNIAAVRTLPADDGPPAGTSPFEEMAALYEDRPNPFALTVDPSPRQIDLLPQHHPRLSRWLMVDNHMQVAVNRATYDTYLRHVNAIGFADPDTLVIEASNEYVKDWFQRHIAQAYIETYNRVDRRDGQVKPGIVFSVVVEGDDQYREKGKS